MGNNPFDQFRKLVIFIVQLLTEVMNFLNYPACEILEANHQNLLFYDSPNGNKILNLIAPQLASVVLPNDLEPLDVSLLSPVSISINVDVTCS